jgi:hypothetical protein
MWVLNKSWLREYVGEISSDGVFWYNFSFDRYLSYLSEGRVVVQLKKDCLSRKRGSRLIIRMARKLRAEADVFEVEVMDYRPELMEWG